MAPLLKTLQVCGISWIPEDAQELHISPLHPPQSLNVLKIEWCLLKAQRHNANGSWDLSCMSLWALAYPDLASELVGELAAMHSLGLTVNLEDVQGWWGTAD